MPTPRSRLVDFKSPGVYHCISRCVRRAFLCGGAMSDRKAWIHERMIHLAEIFAIDVGGFAILDNHFHNVLATHPEIAEEWTSLEVCQRWFRLFPRSIQRWALPLAREDARLAAQITDEGILPDDAAIRTVAECESKVEILRRRLSNLSWFMRCLKHRIAVRANREDGCTGHFWEGRFKSIRVLDVRALLKTMLYVDLNVIRAGGATTPESSPHTSVQDRIHVRQHYQKQRGERKTAPARARRLLRAGRHGSPDSGGWLAPIRQLIEMTVDQYLTTIDLVGRGLRSGRPRSIPAELAPILDRIDMTKDDLADVLRMMETDEPLHGSVAGSPASCAREAVRRRVRHVLSAFRGGRGRQANGA